MWQKIDSYKFDEDGIGRRVPVAWYRDGGAVVRIAEGFSKDGKVSWHDPYADEGLEPPDYWFDLPPLRGSWAWTGGPMNEIWNRGTPW